jgi:hypothetical protein
MRERRDEDPRGEGKYKLLKLVGNDSRGFRTKSYLRGYMSKQRRIQELV